MDRTDEGYNRRVIDLPWKVPKDYQRKFVFMDGRFRQTISIDGKPEIVIEWSGKPSAYNSEASNDNYDWMAVAIMTIRGELGV